MSLISDEFKGKDFVNLFYPIVLETLNIALNKIRKTTHRLVYLNSNFNIAPILVESAHLTRNVLRYVVVDVTRGHPLFNCTKL